MQFSRIASAVVGMAAVVVCSAGAEAQGFRREGRIEAREARQEGRYDARNFGNYGGYAAPGGVYYGPYYGPSYSSGYYGYNGPQYHGPAYGSYATNRPSYYAPPARYDDNIVYHGHERAVLGVTLGENRDGVVTIQQITPDSPAEEAGLRRGDEILAINGRQVFSYRDVTRMIADHQPNDLVELSIGRNGRERAVQATLAGREVPNRPLTSAAGNYPVAPGAGGYYGPENTAPGGYYSPRQARRARNAAIDPELYSEPYAY
jgi:hypothetical protein